MRRVEAVVEAVVTAPRADPPPARAAAVSKRLRTGIRAGWVAMTDDGTT